MKNTLKKNLITLSIALSTVLLNTSKVFADGGSNGYGHRPVDTAIAGMTDQTSIFAGLGLFVLGTIILSSSQILNSFINKDLTK